MRKEATVGQILKQERKEDRKLNGYILTYSISQVPISLFKKEFGEMTQSELIDFIKNDENGYELSKFGHRFDETKYNTYNGKSIYQGMKCTLGASHSNTHG